MMHSNSFLVTAAAMMNYVPFPHVAPSVLARLAPTRNVSLTATVTRLVQMWFQLRMMIFLLQNVPTKARPTKVV